MEWCINYDDTPQYLQMIVKYLDKNSTCLNKALNSYTYFISLAVKKKRNLEWFKTIFDLYSTMNKVPRKLDFKDALRKKHFKQISKECQEMIKENYIKFYPK